MIEEETNPKDTIERFRRLILQEKVESVHGLISTGVSLGVAPVAEEEQALMVMWDGTTQDGVKEMMPNPKYVFRSTDNECEAVMGSLLAVKHFKGKFKRVAGINPDYSYGRNNWEAFKQILARYGVEYIVVGSLENTYYWPEGQLKFDQMVAEGTLQEVFRDEFARIYRVVDTEATAGG